MARIEEQIEIAAPPTTVFRLCHDISLRAKWDERVVGIEMLTTKPARAGTLLRIDARQSNGPVFSWEGEYVNLQFPRSSELRVLDAAPSSWFNSGKEEWRFSAVGSGTRFTLVWDYRPRGFLGRILDQLGRRTSMQRAIRRSLSNLKTLVESQ